MFNIVICSSQESLKDVINHLKYKSVESSEQTPILNAPTDYIAQGFKIPGPFLLCTRPTFVITLVFKVTLIMQ